ncbi:hypothetical protein O3P69_010744 [Scylla paramamosain]|uniref:Uncharacterized protein n=1 Tax=Scylla paramamosain TaxID=85552 RepID=A0AAW0TG41_SCYPA
MTGVQAWAVWCVLTLVSSGKYPPKGLSSPGSKLSIPALLSLGTKRLEEGCECSEYVIWGRETTGGEDGRRVKGPMDALNGSCGCWEDMAIYTKALKNMLRPFLMTLEHVNLGHSGEKRLN